MRRITFRCDEPINYPRWIGDSDRINGYYVFSQERCGKLLEVLYENEYDLTEDYIPLDRDPYGRILPVGNKREQRQCGHITQEFTSTKEERDQKRSVRWKKVLPFQQNAVELIEGNDLNGYCCFDTGTGKTIISASLIAENFEKMTPCLITCEAGDIFRFRKELTKHLGGKELMEQGDIEGGIARIPQIVTDDTFEFSLSPVLITSWTNIKNEKVIEWLGQQNFKSIISDEAHMYKDENSKRTQAFIKIASQTPHKIFLSATWLENKITEAFVPLNILDPMSFPKRSSLLRYCVADHNGKAYSIHPYWRQTFLDKIKPYVFRLTKEQAGLKFPDKYSYSIGNREPLWQEIDNIKSNLVIINEYNKELDRLEEEINNYKPSYNTVIGLMSSLRHLTGRMKVTKAAKFVHDWVKQNPGKKFCIGTHHKFVMEGLAKYLGILGIQCLTMSSETAKKKDEIELEWKTSKDKNILIASILGAGKGRNFQFCRDALVLERQWNKSKELQFEGRFHRVMFDAEDNLITEFTEEDDVTIDYLMATKTFDEYFDELVNLKGVIVDSADSDVDEAPPEGFVLELARRMVSKRVKYTGF